MFRLIYFVLLSGIVILTNNAQAGQTTLASEIMLLPQFCWAQYPPHPKGPQYEIHDCGPGMNHYCPALIEYIRANRIISRGPRENKLKIVLKEAEYTLRWMKDYPACPIRSHVEKTYSRVRVDLGLPPVINQAQPASIHAPAITAVESNAAKASTSESESGSVVVDKQESSSPPQDGEAKSIEPTKIGTPINPYCRFCPPE